MCIDRSRIVIFEHPRIIITNLYLLLLDYYYHSHYLYLHLLVILIFEYASSSMLELVHQMICLEEDQQDNCSNYLVYFFYLEFSM